MNANKVIAANPIAKMVKRADAVQFEAISRNGFFVQLNGNDVLELDKMPEAAALASSLNSAILIVLSDFRVAYETKVRNILNA